MNRLILGTLILAAVVGMMSRPTQPDEAVAPSALAPPTESGSVAPRPVVGNGYADIAITRSADGHFYADLMVNGAPVHFLVDTGASVVALTRDDAQKVGLQFSEGEFTASAQTAGGPVGVKPVTLDRMTLGALEATAVQGAIIERGLSVSLLGQSWLGQVGHVTIEGDVMTLR